MKNTVTGEVLAGGFCGLLFGCGLVWSGMANPAKVLGFLNLSGQWDPTLVVVMAGALLVSLPGFWLVKKAAGPLLCDTFQIPSSTRIDKRLVSGAVIFGLGWGLAGLCPGPAMAGLSSGEPGIYIFVAAMLVGMLLHDKGPLGG